MFASRSFKPVQDLQHYRLQPLWPQATRGSMQPVDRPGTSLQRGVRPKTDGRPGSIIGVQSLFQDGESD
eukprot:COSAG05_NODE_21399_length_272_cov_0.601156_1_plen_68_part_10